MDACQVEECEAEVSKKGFKLCYDHWKADQAGQLYYCNECRRPKESGKPLCLACFRNGRSNAPVRQTESILSSTHLGESFGLSAQRINLILAELGWISKELKGWSATRPGLKAGAIQKEHQQTGVPYVVWPDSVRSNSSLRAAVQDLIGDITSPQSPPAETPALNGAPGFREKFEATHRSQDGHFVRSKAEMLIDNWLYQASIVHAYERKLPVEEEAYCDFWIPSGKVYIEYWGMEANPKYAERMHTKKEIYKKYGFNLIELNDDEIRNLDDHLPRKLLKYGVQTP